MDLRNSGPSRAIYWIHFLPIVILLRPSLNAQEPLNIDVLAANRALWPREVAVNVAHQVPLLVNGKVSGSMQALPGRVYPVKSVEPSAVVVDAMGSSLTFPPADTDILARAETGEDATRSARRGTRGDNSSSRAPSPPQPPVRPQLRPPTRLPIDSMESL